MIIERSRIADVILIGAALGLAGHCAADGFDIVDVTDAQLPRNVLGGRSMDARPGDLNNDGFLDLAIATEFGPNIILLNNQQGGFIHLADAFPPGVKHDSEDVAIEDFDLDGDLDVIFVSEDTMINEYYLNDGSATFTDVSERIPVTGVSNAIFAADIDSDGDKDILIGNAGLNFILINDGKGFFTDETNRRAPLVIDQTQDLEAADVDGDGDVDWLIANEDGNRLLMNDGHGVFSDESDRRLPPAKNPEETREADFGDVDGDGDLDIIFANVNFIGDRDPHNRLLINNGKGVFSDQSGKRLPRFGLHSVDADFVDIDHDGDLDIVVANAFGGDYQMLQNNAKGVFIDASDVLPESVRGDGIDVEAADFTGDDRPDYYLCNYRQGDRLLHTRPLPKVMPPSD